MTFGKPLPGPIKARLDRITGRKEKVRIRVASDMADSLKFGDRWLIVTEKRVLVFGGAPVNGAGPVDIPLSEVLSAFVVHIVGGGVVIIRTRSGARAIIHYSNSLTQQFAEAAKGIEQLAKGKRLSIATEFRPHKCHECGRLLPDPNERCPFCIKYIETMKRIVHYLLPYKWKVVATGGVTIAATFLELVPPQINRRIIDVALPGKDFHMLGWMVLGLVALNATGAIMNIFNGRQLSWLGGRTGTDIRSQVFRAVEKLQMKFFDRRHTGHIMSRVMNDSNQLQNFLIDGFPFLAQNAVQLVLILGFLLAMSPLLTFLVLVPVPVLFTAQFLFWKYVRGLAHKTWTQYALLNTRLNESVSGVRVVKAFSQEEHEIKRFDRQNDKMFEASYRENVFWAMFFPGMSFLVFSGSLIVWYVGGGWIIKGYWTLGTLIAFNAYLWTLYRPLQWFSQVNNWMTRAFAGAERIFETIDTAPEIYDPPDAVPMKKFRGEIEFRDVCFAYEKGKAAIKNVSFKVRPGEMIGLVGKSGSGKTTLLSLLCRFYIPDEGQILIDGVPIEKIRLRDLRDNIGIVLQDPFLFGFSIYENIGYSRPQTTADQVITAARAANAHEFIMGKNDAYDTRVGERGNRLSGGEKQRISIARAILHNPKILVLDEATSSVDSETEAKIQQALDRLVRNRTTMVAAHRLSTLRAADRIFVMEDGELAESGNHDELLRNKGRYYRLVKAQEKAWRRSKKNMSLDDGGHQHGRR
jgi:ATP-binding cassette subfamily B protein